MKLPDKVVYAPPSPPLLLSSYDLAPPPATDLQSPSSSSPPEAQPDWNFTPPQPLASAPAPPPPDSSSNGSPSAPPSCPNPDPYCSPPESVSPPPSPPESESSPPPPMLDSPPLATFYPSPPPPLPFSPPPPASLSPPSSFLYSSPPPPPSLAYTSPSPPQLPPPEPAPSPPPTTSSPPVQQSPPPRSPPPPSPETPSPPLHSPPPPFHKTYVPPPKAHHGHPSLPSAVKPRSHNSSLSTPDPQKGLGVTTSTAATIAVVSGLVMLTFLGAAAWFVKKHKKTLEPSGQGRSVAAVTGSSQSHLTETTYPRSPSYPLVRHSSGSYARYTSGSYGFPYSPSEAGLGNMKLWFTLEDLSVITDGFSSQNLLGEGGFGSVFKGSLPDGRLVAVKQLKVGGKQGEREFQSEVETISRVHHRHLVSLVGYCISENQRLLVYDYVPNNTLYYHLHEKRSPVIGWTTRVKIAAGAAHGIAYLHEDCHPRIIHRDIKSSNILLDNNFEAQVSDFGLARSALDSNTHVTTRVMGTFGYLAPEYASSGKLTAKSDVYSFGVVLLELITGRKPVDSSRPLGDESLVEWSRPLLIQALETGDLGVLPDPRLEENYLEEEMLSMIETAAACVRHSATMRPRMSQVVRVLDGLAESNDITNGIRPGQSEIFESSPQTEEIRIFRRREFGCLDSNSNEYISHGNRHRRTNL